MSHGIRRRKALVGAALAGPLGFLLARGAKAEDFGPLVVDPAGVLDLPAGFSYRVLETAGDDMSDGYRLPGRPDGMDCFAGDNGTVVLMRNHELSPGSNDDPYKPGQQPPAETFDTGSVGGVTRLVLDESTYERVSSNLVLVGTNRNCAGGWSPWGWLSCEENVSSGHGYVFVCSDTADKVEQPQRIVGYGRFNHEAATVHPDTMICYLTEDRSTGCFYRFAPTDKSKPFEGKLQALKVVGKTVENTGLWDIKGKNAAVEWVDIVDPDPPTDSIRDEAKGKGAAIFRRGEGIFRDGDKIYFCCTSGGPASRGQIFCLDTKAQNVELVGVSPGSNVLDMPDNIAVCPWGDIMMAEDGGGTNYLRGLRADGSVYDFAKNALNSSELAGACFSPKGDALFVNIQTSGLTLVVTGPFPVTNPGTTTATGAGGAGATTGSAQGGATGAGGANASGAGGANASTTGAGSGSEDPAADSGCGCTTVGQGGKAKAAWVAAAGVAAAVLRRDEKPKKTD